LLFTVVIVVVVATLSSVKTERVSS
jgi:hypothetical protein